MRRGKIADPYYSSPEWRALRRRALALACGRCATPGCNSRATRVDHIVSRRHGGANALANLRCLCTVCDNKLKEDRQGMRRSGGAAVGTGVDGWPIEAPR
jgi:5-methylcytosine-specific restriction endonuclease McrA